MFSATSQFHFAAELVAMLVAASGLVVVALRSDLTRRRLLARVALAAGLAVSGAVAFVVGAGLSTASTRTDLDATAATGSFAVLVGTSGWRAGHRSRRALATGAVVGVGSWIAYARTVTPAVAVDAALVVASVLVGLALVGAGRRSIATRVAANTAGTLLLVVLVLSIALSAVISSSVQHQQLVSLRSRTALQAGELLGQAATALTTSRIVAADLEAVFPERPGGRGGLGSGRVPSAAILARLRTTGSFFPAGSLVYVTGGGTQVASAPAPAGLANLDVARGLGCAPSSAGSTGRREVAVLDGRAYALGAFAACAAQPLRQVGRVVVAVALGPSVLAGLRGGGQSLSLVGPTGTVATVGSAPAPRAVSIAQRASTAGASSYEQGSDFVATVPLAEAGGAPSVALVVSESPSELTATRNSLDRTLLVIALGGTLLALVLAALTGDRITSGLRRLTRVAQEIRSGGASSRAGVVSSDEVGVLAGAFDAMVDSVEEKNAALRDAAIDESRLRARLEAVVGGMTEALVAVDADGHITDFNRSAVELTGVGMDEAVGRRAVDVLAFTGEEGREVAASLTEPGRPPWSGVTQVVRADGGVVPVALSSGSLRDQLGEPRGLVVVLRDLRAEQQVERMKTEFLSRVGHELRTPLTGILGYADILVRRPVSADQARVWHGEILQAAKRQLRVVRLLEFFASDGAGRVVLEPKATAVRDLVDGVVADWQLRLPPGSQLTVRVADGLPAVRIDRRWTALALDELIDNALKFSPGGGRVTVEAGMVTGDGRGGVEVAVVDHGVGMDEVDREQAFAEFVQGDPTDTRSYGGLGLGLALVQRVVAGHAGTVSCRSVPGEGTTMTMRFAAGEAGDGNVSTSTLGP